MYRVERAACLMRRSSLCRKGRNLFPATRWRGARAMVMICRRQKFLTVLTLVLAGQQTHDSTANSKAAVNWLKNFALCLGCGHVEEITPEDHDKIIAYTSNLPHAAAAALINSDRFSGQSCWFIGGGFRDVTRIADINAGLWSDLFLENRENVLSELENFRTQIETLQKLINENNREGLQEFLQKAACHRKEIVL